MYYHVFRENFQYCFRSKLIYLLIGREGGTECGNWPTRTDVDNQINQSKLKAEIHNSREARETVWERAPIGSAEHVVRELLANRRMEQLISFAQTLAIVLPYLSPVRSAAH